MTEREETLDEILKILRAKRAKSEKALKDMEPLLVSFYAGLRRGIESCIEDIESLER